MTLKWKRAKKKQKQQTNGNKAIWLVYRTDANAPGFWLVKRTLGWKNVMPEELSRNCFDVILQHDWSIEQCLLHIRVFFGGKTKSPCFVLFIHWLIKQITNTYGNHFSRSYENRSIGYPECEHNTILCQSPSTIALHEAFLGKSYYSRIQLTANVRFKLRISQNRKWAEKTARNNLYSCMDTKLCETTNLCV